VWVAKRSREGNEARLFPIMIPIVPVDDRGNFDWGPDINGYCGFEEPPPSYEPEDGDDDDDDEDFGGDDNVEDSTDDDDDDDDDDNPLDQMSGMDRSKSRRKPAVIETEGEEVGDDGDDDDAPTGGASGSEG
jgi:hypothetical protein